MIRALRALAARPGYTAVAVATLALGFGVNAAIFSLTRQMLLRPLPYRDADRLVTVNEVSASRGITNAGTAPINYVAWRERVDAFEQTTVFRRVSFNVSTATDAMQVEGFRIAPTFFSMLGVEPALGRGLSDEDARPGRDDVVLLSDGFWHRRFGADPGLIGRSIDVDGTSCTVVGILPPSFKIYRVLNRELDLFRPFVLDPTDRVQSINVYAKMKPGVSLDAARAEVATVYATLPIPDHAWSGDVSLLSTRFAAQSRSMLIALEWAAAFVLLIACANVANLLLAAAAGRGKELAVRLALGAGRWRIARDLCGETLTLTFAGGAVAILLAMWIVAALNAAVSFQDINRLEPFRVDRWVLAFTGGLACAVALVFGTLPVRTAGAVDVVDALKESTHGTTAGVSNRRLRHALIIGELALSIVLGVSALALSRSALASHNLARGVTIDHVTTAQVAFNNPRYIDTGQLVRTAAAIVDRLGASPGIDVATLVNYPPLSAIRVGVPVTIEGLDPPPGGQPWIARYWVAGPNYFRTAGIRMLAGRDFTLADDAARDGVAIVSETFAKRFWKTTDVVGRHVRPEFPRSDAFWIPRASGRMLTIVGVVRDVREDGLPDAAGLPQLYLPFAQNPTKVVTLMARTTGRSAESAARLIREAVRAVDPQLPVSYEMTFDDVLRETFARPRELAWLIGAFAALALLLSAIGVYGVVSYLTAARTREIGIRVALGATHAHVVGLVVGDAMRIAAAGLAVGVIVTPLALKGVNAQVYGFEPWNPGILAVVGTVLGLVCAAAAAIPARRAARQASTTFR